MTDGDAMTVFAVSDTIEDLEKLNQIQMIEAVLALLSILVEDAEHGDCPSQRLHRMHRLLLVESNPCLIRGYDRLVTAHEAGCGAGS